MADNPVGKSAVLYIYESIVLENALIKSSDADGNGEAMKSTISLVEGIKIKL